MFRYSFNLCKPPFYTLLFFTAMIYGLQIVLFFYADNTVIPLASWVMPTYFIIQALCYLYAGWLIASAAITFNIIFYVAAWIWFLNMIFGCAVYLGYQYLTGVTDPIALLFHISDILIQDGLFFPFALICSALGFYLNKPSPIRS